MVKNTKFLDNGLYVINDNEVAAFSPKDYVETPVIEVPEGITKIGKGAFADVTKIKKIILPDSLEIIEEGAFSKSSIEEVIFEKGLVKIEKEAFANCKSIKSIVLPESLISVDDGAFYGCKNLERVILANAIKFIGEHCFDGCIKLKEIELPASVNAIGDEAFPDIAEVTIKGEHIPHNFVGAVTTPYIGLSSTYLKGCGRLSVKINFKGKLIFLPKYIDENLVSKCECALSSDIDEMTQNLHRFGVKGTVSYDTAYWQYKSILKTGKEPCEELKRYVKKMSKNIFLMLLLHGLEEEQIYFVKLGLFTKNTLRQLYETLSKDKNPVLAAYLLNEIQKDNKKSKSGKLSL